MAETTEQSPAPVVDPNTVRMKELVEFDETKGGVKGLVDSGIRNIPRIFKHAAEDLPKPSDCHDASFRVPVIDLQGLDDTSHRRQVVYEICEASMSWGFFQLVNHGVPIGVLDGMIQGTRRFHEQDREVKAELYSRDGLKKVKYSSNFDLFTSPAANWRDTFGCFFDCLDAEELPSVLREETLDYRQQLMGVADTVCELLSESLGLKPEYLKSIESTKTQTVVAHYYPPCPEPELTLGSTKHTDPVFLTLLLQDDHGGLQVLHQNQWVDVSPVPGSLVVNIGDFLQLISNDKFKSVEHRVLASHRGPRVSIALFFSPSRDEERLYGPIKEALSDENPPIYREVLVMDYLTHFTKKGLGRESTLSYFKL